MAEFEQATMNVNVRNRSIRRLSALIQAAPALAAAGTFKGTRLMKVVIRGDLVRSADGNGLRAFTMGPNGVKEHARLFEPSNVQNLINVAAVWQVASVIVAQKHLADISDTLGEIKDRLAGISQFLDNQRTSRIASAIDYYQQAIQTIQGGELSASVRNQLENCERDLIEIQRHLEIECRQKVDAKVKHEETVGTKDLTDDIALKIDDLTLLFQGMLFCLKARIVGWRALSLYPGEQRLKSVRRKQMLDTVKSIERLTPYCMQKVGEEISGVKSIWNSTRTLNARKEILEGKCNKMASSLELQTKQCAEAVRLSDEAIFTQDQASCLLLEYDGASLARARLK